MGWRNQFPRLLPDGLQHRQWSVPIMKRLLLFLLLASPALAQTIYLTDNSTSIAPFTVPQGTTLPITAIVNGTNNKGVNWTSTGGTLTNAACTANGPCTVSIYSATTTGVITLTATSAANPAVSASTHIQFGSSPVPASAANTPSFLITPANLSTLQARAAGGSNLAFNAL